MKETPQQYTQRILSHAQGQEPLKIQAATPKKLQRLLSRATASKLRKRPAPDKWSIAEIVVHLADAEIAGSWRMRLILGAPGTPVSAFDQDVVGHRLALRQARCAQSSRAISRAARNKSRHAKSSDAGAVETLRHTLGTRRGND